MTLPGLAEVGAQQAVTNGLQGPFEIGAALCISAALAATCLRGREPVRSAVEVAAPESAEEAAPLEPLPA